MAGTARDAIASPATPLLAPRPPDARRLPRLQLALLCYARVMEPIAFFSIFPYIARMVQRNGHLPDSDVGFYSGLIESLFSLAQMAMLLLWGRLADRVGRKPILVASLAGLTVGPALFGLARSLRAMLLYRALAGAVSGSNLTIRTMMGDLSTPATQARVFSWFAFAGNVGILLGPMIGGALANPAAQYPRLFADSPFFQEYPYSLPGFAVAAISATSALTTVLFVDETLPGKRPPPEPVPGPGPERGGHGCDCDDGDDDDAAAAAAQAETKAMSAWQLVGAPGVALVLWTYGHVMLLAFAFTAILPVALFTPVALGGLGCDSLRISLYLAVQGASQALWLLLAFPRLQRRLGTRGLLRCCARAYPFFFAGYAAMNLLLRRDAPAATAAFWLLAAAVALVGPAVSMAFTAVQLALNDVAPDPRLLGTLNAVALTFASAIRSVVPGLATAVYAVGVRHQILRGHLAWALLMPISASLLVVLRWLPPAPS